MASNLYVPFNHAPSSVAVKTASYAIPAGKYARVIVEVDSGGIFTINGVSAVTSAAFVNVDVVAGFSGGPATYNVPTGYRAELQGCPSTAGTGAYLQINTNIVAGGLSKLYYGDHAVGPGGVFTVAGDSGNAGTSGVAIPSNATHRQADIWVPTGTTIAGSGNWRAVVMEYNEIT